jgi:superoxide dismutase, Fe-Mn family
MDKRKFLKLSSIAGASVMVAPFIAVGEKNQDQYENKNVNKLQLGAFVVPALGYAFDALEPHIDAMTMEIHHDKHHGAYVSKLNDAMNGSRFEGMTIEKIMSEVKEEDKAIRNNAGGHYNHSLFWKIIMPGEDKMPTKKINQLIIEGFGSFEKFKEMFTEVAKQVFGSGWAWLAVDQNKKLFISTTPNQDNPLMSNIAKQQGTPILGLDVWEHAYYLKHQNKRIDYITDFFNIINWKQVELNYDQA